MTATRQTRSKCADLGARFLSLKTTSSARDGSQSMICMFRQKRASITTPTASIHAPLPATSSVSGCRSPVSSTTWASGLSQMSLSLAPTTSPSLLPPLPAAQLVSDPTAGCRLALTLPSPDYLLNLIWPQPNYRASWSEPKGVWEADDTKLSASSSTDEASLGEKEDEKDESNVSAKMVPEV